MGIYIHIPFCTAKCSYCDFYSLPEVSLIDDYVNAVVSEARLRRSFFPSSEPVSTLYFGGGTPSLLPPSVLNRIFIELSSVFNLSGLQEITMEANPDDLTRQYLSQLASQPDLHVNRLSIGIQSFSDATLRLFRRRHTAAQAAEAVDNARDAGFSNVSLDLIYAYPGQTPELLHSDVRQLLALSPTHISAYQLSFEHGTRLTAMKNKRLIEPLDDDLSAILYEQLIAELSAAGFLHYEISNFSLPGFRSRHNSSYWNLTPYLGLGPAAHSFDGITRFHNPPSLRTYISSLLSGELTTVNEQTSISELYSDYLITSLRTADGTSLPFIRQRFGQHFVDLFLSSSRPFLSRGQLRYVSPDSIALSGSAVLVSDSIFADLII